MGKVVAFRDPSQPWTGAKRLEARRIFRKACRDIARSSVAKALRDASRTPGAEGIGTKDALPLFVAAMRRELRKSRLF